MRREMHKDVAAENIMEVLGMGVVGASYIYV